MVIKANLPPEGTSQKYGRYSFTKTTQHLSRNQLDQLRHQYDEFGKQVLERLQQLGRNTTEGNSTRLDLFEVLKNNYETDTLLGQFWRHEHDIPAWVNWDQIARGQKVFSRYAVPLMIGLALQGFVVENTAAPGNVEVLVRTGGFSKKVLLARLIETFQWIIQITNSLDSMKPGGDGHVSTIRVHLLHGCVRQRLWKLAEQRPGYYDTSKLGPPINYLDSIHAISNLCANALWLQLPMMGITPTAQEAADWIALFRYIAYLLATPDEYFSGPRQAKNTMESIIANEWQMSENSGVILNNFVNVLVDLPWFNFSRDFIVAGARIINGEKMCDDLGLEQSTLFSYATFRGLIWLCRAMTAAQRTFAIFDEFMIQYWRELLYDKVVRTAMQGGGKFHFRHVPALGYISKADLEQRDVKWIWERRVEAIGLAIFGLSWLVFLLTGLGLLLMTSRVVAYTF